MVISILMCIYPCFLANLKLKIIIKTRVGFPDLIQLARYSGPPLKLHAT